MAQIDLDQLVGRADVSIKSQETPEDANHRRWKDKLLFVVVLVVIVGVLLFFLYESFLAPGTGIEDKRWMQSLAFSIISGFIGFLLGKKA